MNIKNIGLEQIYIRKNKYIVQNYKYIVQNYTIFYCQYILNRIYFYIPIRSMYLIFSVNGIVL